MDIIYKITSPKGKVYIGRTNDFERRMIEHKYNAFTKKLPNSLYRACRKYGWENMIKEIILEVSPENSQKLEEELISAYNSVRLGYNDTYVGGGGDQWAGRKDTTEYQEFCNKMRRLNVEGNNPMTGKTHSEESKALQKEKAKGRFSLPWFIERNGEEEGTRKYQERCYALKNRQCMKGSNNPMNKKEVVEKRKKGLV